MKMLQFQRYLRRHVTENPLDAALKRNVIAKQECQSVHHVSKLDKRQAK